MNTSPSFSSSPHLFGARGQSLLTHYLESVYEVYAPAQEPFKNRRVIFSFRIGEFVPVDSRQDLLFGTLAGAYLITACNPASQPLSPLENERRQRQLALQIEDRGWLALPAAGRSVDASWAEPSFLVIGATELAVRKLMRDWGQNAWLWIDPAGQVHLQHHGQCPADPSLGPDSFF